MIEARCNSSPTCNERHTVPIQSFCHFYPSNTYFTPHIALAANERLFCLFFNMNHKLKNSSNTFHKFIFIHMKMKILKFHEFLIENPPVA